MSGLSDYAAKAQLAWVAGQTPFPTAASVFLALMTAVDTDAGSGGTEVTGGSYARVQVAGQLAAASTITGGTSTTITLGAPAPAWLLALGTNGSGVNVYDVTAAKQIGTVSSISGSTVTLTGAASNSGSGSTDTLAFSAFSVPSGSAPSQITNGASITFPQASAGWGTVIAFELRDASSSGNLLAWDYLGNFSWFPATVSAASPGVITAHAHGYLAADTVVWSNEYGGTVPTFSQSNFTGLLAVVGPATDTFTVTNGGTAVNTSATGNGMVRKVLQQPIAINVTASFAASALTITSA